MIAEWRHWRQDQDQESVATSEPGRPSKSRALKAVTTSPQFRPPESKFRPLIVPRLGQILPVHPFTVVPWPKKLAPFVGPASSTRKRRHWPESNPLPLSTERRR